MTDLKTAHREWATRGPDERFWSVREAREMAERYKSDSAEVTMARDAYIADEPGNDLVLANAGARYNLSHHGFQSLCQRAGAPADYLRRLPASLASRCLNTGLERKDGSSELLVTGNYVRAALSDRYERVWNAEVFRLLESHVDLNEWQLPPAGPLWDRELQAELEAAGQLRYATEADLRRTSTVQLGQPIVPSGCYCSDHDMFVFLINDSRRINDGSDGGLGRGVFIKNSEVGKSSLKVTFFLYRYVCQNHIVWNATGIREIALRHTKGIHHRRLGLSESLLSYSHSSSANEEGMVLAAKQKSLGQNDTQVQGFLFDRRILTQTQAKDVILLAKKEADLRPGTDPRSVWGVVQGVTSLSQTPEYVRFADKRVELDAVVPKLLRIVS